MDALPQTARLTAPAIHPQERERLEALRSYRILDTSPEKGFDDIAYLATSICRTPMAMVTFVDRDREWFKARAGFEVHQLSRAVSLGAHAILRRSLTVVSDLTQDPRFAENPNVTGGPELRFYAAAPFFGANGLPLGTVCAMDREPRTLSVAQEESLRALSRLASALLEWRRTHGELVIAQDTLNLYGAILPVCSSCRKMKTDDGTWVYLEDYVQGHSHESGHGICPDCARRLYPDYLRS